MKPITDFGVSLLILRELNKLDETPTTNEIARRVHVKRDAVIKALQTLSAAGLVEVTESPRIDGSLISTVKTYSLPKGAKRPVTSVGVVGPHGLDLDLKFLKVWSETLISKLMKGESYFDTDDSKKKMSVYWNKQRKKSLEKLYVPALVRFDQLLHLYLSELVALDQLYKLGVIYSREDLQHTSKRLAETFFGSQLCDEMYKLVVEMDVFFQ